MDIRPRWTAFAMTTASWIVWVVIGLAVGGVVEALQRALHLAGGAPGGPAWSGRRHGLAADQLRLRPEQH